MTTPTAVVLGASGYLGGSVVRSLAGRGLRVRAVGRRDVTTPEGVEVVRADVTSATALREVVDGADLVVDLLAHNDEGRTWRDADASSEAVNVGVVRDLLQALGDRPPASPTPVVVLASTLQAEDDGHATLSPYAEQKVRAERLLHEADASGVVRATSLRLSTLVGVCSTTGNAGAGVFAGLAERALDGDALTVWDAPLLRRDLLDVADAGEAFAAAHAHVDALRGRPWVVGRGESTPLRDAFVALADAVGRASGRPPVPVHVAPAPSDVAGVDLRAPACDVRPWSEVTGWTAAVALEESLAATARAVVARHSARTKEA